MENVIEIMNTKEKLVAKFGYDEMPDSPRNWDNIGTFYTWENRYSSPDGNGYGSMTEFIESIIGENMVEKLKGKNTNITSLFEDICDKFDKKGYILYPVSRYEHGMVRYYIGDSEGWDTGVVGVIFAEKEKIYKEFGVKKISKKIREKVEKVFEDELEIYTNFANGDVYRISVEDFDGKELESSGDIYGDLYLIEEAIKVAQDFMESFMGTEEKDDDFHGWEVYDEDTVEDLREVG